MKRSEALKIIDEQYGKYVDELVKLDMDDEKVMESFVKLDERVLTALEKAGMLPPSIELPSFGTRDNAWEREE
jgi:hypothetical protein